MTYHHDLKFSSPLDTTMKTMLMQITRVSSNVHRAALLKRILWVGLLAAVSGALIEEGACRAYQACVDVAIEGVNGWFEIALGFLGYGIGLLLGGQLGMLGSTEKKAHLHTFVAQALGFLLSLALIIVGVSVRAFVDVPGEVIPDELELAGVTLFPWLMVVLATFWVIPQRKD